MVTCATGDDLADAAEVCCRTLEPFVDRDWVVQAGNLRWTCRQVLEHLCTLPYVQSLATRSRISRRVALIADPEASIDDCLWTLKANARVLADVAQRTPSSARAYHPAGLSDAGGFIAMFIDELLVHTHDITVGLNVGFHPPDRLATVTLKRLFPWAPGDQPPWATLLWANGRGSLPGHEALGEAWLWWSPPLDEWDGSIPRWDPETNSAVSDRRASHE